MKKRVLALALAAAMCLGLAACGGKTTPSEPPVEEGAYKAGTYEASADGRNGPVKVSVTFTADAIESVKITEHTETAGISDPAINDIPTAIVTYQSLGVDAISGATITSDAILAAVADCVTQAGGDVEALKAVPAGGEKVEGALQDATVDVLVVGGGGAGLSAALSAAQNGASVILVEKLSALGGNTLLCGGAFNTADPEGQAPSPWTTPWLPPWRSSWPTRTPALSTPP